MEERLTFFFEKDTTFCHNDGYISIYETLAVFVGERDGHIGVFDADIKRYTEYTARRFCADKTLVYHP